MNAGFPVQVSSQQITKHPQYMPDQKYYDIAIIELEHDVEFTPYIFPACLETNESDEKKNLTIIGFGRTDRLNRHLRATWLQKASVEEVPLKQCNATYQRVFSKLTNEYLGMSNGMTKAQLCGLGKSNKDSCQVSS